MSDFLDRKFGPLKARAWGLIVNFLCNILGLYGLAQFLNDGSGLPALIVGGAGTLAAILVLATPSK